MKLGSSLVAKSQFFKQIYRFDQTGQSLHRVTPSSYFWRLKVDAFFCVKIGRPSLATDENMPVGKKAVPDWLFGKSRLCCCCCCQRKEKERKESGADAFDAQDSSGGGLEAAEVRFDVLLVKVGQVDLGAAGDGRHVARHRDDHAQRVEDVDAEEPVLDDHPVAALRELDLGAEVEHSA